MLWRVGVDSEGRGVIRLNNAALGQHLDAATMFPQRFAPKVTSFDAGGLQSPTNPGQNIPGDGIMVVKMTGTKYEQVLPTTIGTQACDSKNLIKLTGSVVDRAKLDANRISQAGK